MQILEFIRSWSNLLIFVLQAAVAGFSWVFWKSVASKGDIRRVEEKVGAVDERVKDLEQERKAAPRREDLHKLEMEMERTRGEMREFRALMDGGRAEFAANLDGIRQLHKRSDHMISIMTEHMIALKGRS